MDRELENRPGWSIDKYRVILFDLFHTLTTVESANAPGRGTSTILGVSREAWNDQLLLYSRDRLCGKIKDPFEIIKRMAREIKPDISDKVVKEAVDNRISRFQYSLQNIPDTTINTIKLLKSRGKILGLISNADATEIYGWHDSPLRKYFNCAVFSCDVGHVKPDKEIYQLGLKILGVLACESIFVGDGGSHELEGAKALGITTVLTTYVVKHLWPEKIEGARKFADFEVDELSEILDI
ncbi:MAG: HAD family hydrolase [bacterium]